MACCRCAHLLEQLQVLLECRSVLVSQQLAIWQGRLLRRTLLSALIEQFVQFANAQGKSPLGARAALALGYYSFKQKQFSDAHAWLEKAAADPVLADYALYWIGMTDRATGANAEALAEFQQYRQRYPSSVMTESAVKELARAALAIDRPQEAVTALDAYERTTSSGEILLLRPERGSRYP